MQCVLLAVEMCYFCLSYYISFNEYASKFIEIVFMSVCVQVDPTGSGRVAAADAALFLKRSGLADLVLGKVSTESNERRCNISLLRM